MRPTRTALKEKAFQKNNSSSDQGAITWKPHSVNRGHLLFALGSQYPGQLLTFRSASLSLTHQWAYSPTKTPSFLGGTKLLFPFCAIAVIKAATNAAWEKSNQCSSVMLDAGKIDFLTFSCPSSTAHHTVEFQMWIQHDGTYLRL